ncbi:hypothetical protein GF352_05075, partial [archaeon]|nr:hypothetical protein [archaeon]
MRRAGLIVILLLTFSFAFAGFDDTSSECETGGYTWLNGSMYYPGTYSFTDDEVGSAPSGWTVDETGGTVQVIGDLGAHHKVLELQDTSGSGEVRAKNGFSSQSSGTIEFWIRKSSNTKYSFFNLGYGGNNALYLEFAGDGYVKWVDDSFNSHNIASYSADTWYHYRIEFDASTDWHLWIDGQSMDGGAGYGYLVAWMSTFDFLRFGTKHSHLDFFNYVDAVGYSWDPDYEVGDNHTPPCCGDDSGEFFYNGTYLCSNGSVSGDGDLDSGFCELAGYDWFSGTITGFGASCCGDDWVWDDFYNSSHVCYDGDLSTNADLSKDYCEARGYEWFQNSLSFSSRNMVDSSALGARRAFAGDVDGDGDEDMIITLRGSGEVVWYNNTIGDGSAWTKEIITDTVVQPDGVFASDIDSDSDIDVLVALNEDSELAWFENTIGDGSAWAKHSIKTSFTDVKNVYTADLDGDGDLDALATAYSLSSVYWFENTAGDGSSWTEHIIDSALTGTEQVVAGDLDGDGDLDVVVADAGADDIIWYENNNGDASSWSKDTIEGFFDYVQIVFIYDMDQDGDLDVIASADNDAEVAWWDNTAGDGSSWSKNIIDSSLFHAQGLFVGDFDGDGDPDVFAGQSGSEVYWYENTNGFGTSWSETLLDNSFTINFDLFASDFDNDGDLDVFATDSDASDVVWYENLGLNGTSGPCCGDDWVWDNFYNSSHICYEGVSSTNADLSKGYCEARGYGWVEGGGTFASDVTYSVGDEPYTVVLGDLDGDGVLDVINTNYNIDSFSVSLGVGDGSFASDVEYSVGSNPLGVVLGDVDVDGDLDVININRGGDSFSVSLNNGDGSFASDVTYSVGIHPYGVSLGDLDGDGVLDVINTNRGGDSFSVSLNNGLTGSNGPCCGDDSGEFFYNNTNLCFAGDLDDKQGACEYYGYKWFHNVNDSSFSGAADYQGTYTFNNDEAGSVPEGWTDTSTGGRIQVISELGSHENVLQLLEDGSAGLQARGYVDFADQTSGTIEFYYRVEQAYTTNQIYLSGVGGTSIALAIHNDRFRHKPASSWINIPNVKRASDNTWYHFKIVFDCATDTYHVFIDGVDSGELDFRTDVDSINKLEFRASEWSCCFHNYVDAVGFSWDPDYTVGDNYYSFACCGDDNSSDNFYNESHMCSHGGVLFDADSVYTYDFLGDRTNYTSGQGICELKGHTWYHGSFDFGNRTDYPTGNMPVSVATGDLNKDGWLDFIISNVGNGVSAYFNDGDGTFTKNADYSITVDYVPWDVALADFNLDGWLDYAVTNGDIFETGHYLTVYFNDGDGTFTKSADYVGGNFNYQIVVADFNLDGWLDIAVACHGPDD